MFKQYDRVKTNKLLQNEGKRTLARGSKGTIVEIFKRGKLTGYYVEFTYQSGKPKALLVLNKDDIELIENEEQQIEDAQKVVQIRPGSVTSLKRKVAASGASRAVAASSKAVTVGYEAAKPTKKTAAKVGPKKKTASKSTKTSGRKGKIS